MHKKKKWYRRRSWPMVIRISSRMGSEPNFWTFLACEPRTSGTNNFVCVFSWRSFSDPCRGGQGPSTSFDGWIAAIVAAHVLFHPWVWATITILSATEAFWNMLQVRPGFVQWKCASHSGMTFFLFGIYGNRWQILIWVVSILIGKPCCHLHES